MMGYFVKLKEFVFDFDVSVVMILNDLMVLVMLFVDYDLLIEWLKFWGI